ncbi:MAG: response regulator [Lachnospiraceae bacterium]|nr:response regulator [Lachnospiraceae bacterium]
MNQRILLIGQTNGFMVNAIDKGLSEEGFLVVRATADINELSRMDDRPRLMLYYLAEDCEEQRETLTWLKDLVAQEESILALIGKEEELESAGSFIPEQLVRGKYVRPVNVRDLAEKLKRLMGELAAEAAKKHILVIDDDGTMLRTIKTWLSDRYRVSMANSGMNAITFLATEKVDLILLDYEMPVVTGPKVLEMLRCEPRTADIPVMFLTVKSDKESVMKVLSLKPVKYLLKTMPPAELVAEIDGFFSMKKGDRLK